MAEALNTVLMLRTFFLGIKIRIFTFWHWLRCAGSLGILVPTPEYMRETGDNLAYMKCELCGRKYNLVRLSFDDDDDTDENENESEDVS